VAGETAISMPRFGFYRSDPRVRFFHALGCGARLEILKLLRDGEKNVNEISMRLKVDKSVASRHLSILRETGMVSARKEGLSVFYTVIDSKVFDIIDLATEILQKINIMQSKSLKL